MIRNIMAMVFSVLMLSAYCTEVGGHITQNTTWTPEDSPYIITSFLYIDPGVTLTILPGTDIRCTGADKNDIYNFMWSGNNQPLAKMIVVHGVIHAVGTAHRPITFDKCQAETDYRWGGIYMYPGAPISTFEFCEIRNTFFCDYIPGDWSLAAIAFQNGLLSIRNCLFENNYVALGTGNLCMDLPVYNCKIISYDDTFPAPFGYATAMTIGASGPSSTGGNYLLTVARCYFTGNPFFVSNSEYTDALFINNTLYNFGVLRDDAEIQRPNYPNISSYGNTIINGSIDWYCFSATESDTVYSRRNTLIKPVDLNPQNSPLILGTGGFGTNYVSDNYLYGCVQVKTTMANTTTSYIFNNTIENNLWRPALHIENSYSANQGGQIRFYNNLVTFWGDYQYPKIVYTYEASPFIYNNTFSGFRTLFRAIGDSDMVFKNNIIPCIQWSSGSVSQDHHPLLINNCLAMPILPPWDLIDGGDNIVANPMFADSLNGDYSLAPNSPCIDAGMYLADLPEFDIRYYRRITPGSPGDSLAVDIGAYEFNSQYIGGLRGMVFDAISGEMIDCAKIEISLKLPEFSDTLGSFVYPTGPGTYTVRASRWDYEDQVIENVVVNEGEEILVTIPMFLTGTAVEDHTTPSIVPKTLRNYPNPFNPETTISFIAKQSGIVKLKIYNLKGQAVKTLCDSPLQEGYHSFPWNGRDEHGLAVSSGIYIARIEMNGEIQIHKMMLVK